MNDPAEETALTATDAPAAGTRDGATDAAGAVPPGTVREVTVDGKRIHLVGTAHISARSAEEVREVIERVRPDSVCVELCEARRQALMSEQAWREMDLFQVVRRKRATMLLVHLVLAAFQRRLGDKLGVKPGAEMVAAIHAAEAAGAEVRLADRDVQITLRRTWRRLTWWDKLRLTVQMVVSLVASPEMSEADIERLKTQDMLSEVMEAFARAFPRAKTALIDERDRYMAHRIRQAPGDTVVAVVGAGHLEGIVRRLGEPTTDSDMAPLLMLPPRSRVGLAVQWALPVLVVGLVVYGFFAADAQASWRMIQIWFLANGLLSGLGAALALAHPAAILAAILAAPLTSLNPMVAAGWVAGLAQVIAKKPRVRDFESLPHDIGTLRGFWHNSVTRVLLVVALANIGSTVGTFLALPLMTRLLG